MVKGTASKGLKGRAKLHYPCRRCGRSSYHKKSGVCSHCGYGKTKKMRKYSWQKKIPSWGRRKK
ncbi:MAG: 50S ribosomal protein L37e [Nanoarchaeota archaeon]